MSSCFFGNAKGGYVDSDIRYGLINEKNELVSQYDFYSLKRLANGNISAIYPDPKERGNKSWGEEGFKFTLNAKGQPLFEYSIKRKDGTKLSKFYPLSNVDAVSSCYYGIALFVRNHKMGVVDYKGNIVIKPIH